MRPALISVPASGLSPGSPLRFVLNAVGESMGELYVNE